MSKRSVMPAPGLAGQFSGFSREALSFFRDLARHNNRDWFQAHKDVYERECRLPMQQLVAALEPRFGASKIMRINRDTRFAADKSPYKTHISAGIGRNYVSLSADGLYVGAGMYKPDSPVLERFRGAIGSEQSGPRLARIVAALRRKGYDVDTHDALTGTPKGYKADHPRIDLLRMKDLFAGKFFKPAPWLSTKGALDRIEKVMIDAKPLTDWIEENVGEKKR
jgi:uncharacterized protein (TIGR02453 family)